MNKNRRRILQSALCAALPLSLSGGLTIASVPSDNRAIVILLRGAMDGLHFVYPPDDLAFSKLRPQLLRASQSNLVNLNGYLAFRSEPYTHDLVSLLKGGELSVVQAVSTPYRGNRSHFDGQDILETGGTAVGEIRDGWLRRMIDGIPGATVDDAITLAQNSMLIGKGAPSIVNWSPGSWIDEQGVSFEKLLDLYQSDLAFLNAANDAKRFAGTTSIENSDGFAKLYASAAARHLLGSARIVSFSIDGWDTHNQQDRTIATPLKTLGQFLSQLKIQLGPIWDSTAIICVTEFGRTVRINGAGGTDHGTGGFALLSGGAVRGGKVFGKWPGLKDSDLFEGRDLNPTSDIRWYLARLFTQMFNVSEAYIERSVFVDLQKESRVNLVG